MITTATKTPNVLGAVIGDTTFAREAAAKVRAVTNNV